MFKALLVGLLLASLTLLFDSYGLINYESRSQLHVKEVYRNLALKAGSKNIEPLVILDSGIINAWTDGSTTTITTGLLKIIKNDDELAMVLSHEISHSLAGDVGRKGEYILQTYLEANADKLGAYLMLRAGYDPCIGKEIFRTFERLFGDDPSPSDHPDNAFRLDQLDLPQCH